MTRTKHERPTPPPVNRGDLIFGEMVRRVRESQGLTQAELAAKLGVDRSAVGHLERAKDSVAEWNLVLYARALGFRDLPDFLAAGLQELRRP